MRGGDCISVCTVPAIFKAAPGPGLAAGTPIIDPGIQACVVSADMPCARACATGALVPPLGGWEAMHPRVLEPDPARRITVHGDACWWCARACPRGAPAPGGACRAAPRG